MREGGKATNTLQLERHYSPNVNEDREVHPHANRRHPDLLFWHPKPTTLNLEWTHTGQWVKVPKGQDQPGGPDYPIYKVARIEQYIVLDGIIRTAVAYGDEDEKLSIWYSVDAMHKAMKWIIPAVSPWVNIRKWKNQYKTSPQPQPQRSDKGG